MDIVGLALGLLSGGGGGILAGKAMNSNMGTMGRAITGIVGGTGLAALARDGELSLERITATLSEDECGEIEAEILFALEAGEQSLKPVSERLGGKYPVSLLRVMQAAIRTEMGVE